MITLDNQTFTVSKAALRALLHFVGPPDRPVLAQVLFCPETGQVWASDGYTALAWRAGGEAPLVSAEAGHWVVPRQLLERAAKLVPARGVVQITREAVQVVLPPSVGSQPAPERLLPRGEYPAFPPMDRAFPAPRARAGAPAWGVNADTLVRVQHLPALVGRNNPYMRCEPPAEPMDFTRYQCNGERASCTFIVTSVKLEGC